MNKVSLNPIPLPLLPLSPMNSSLLSGSDKFLAYTQSKGTYIQQQMAPNTASIKHSITKHCPVITGDDLTFQLLLLAENVFEEYFIAKTVVKEDQVKLILGAFKDIHI
jgi:hypothetical protein